MNFLDINPFQTVAFSLVFLRSTAFFFSWPLFSGNKVPVTIKILLSFIMSFILFSLIPTSDYPLVLHPSSLIFLGVKEVAVGLAMGFLCQLVFFAVSAAGEMVSLAMGISVSQIFNPNLNAQQSPLGHFYFLITAFLFLAIKGHHYFITGLFKSFKLISLSIILPRLNSMGEFVLVGQKVLEMIVFLSAPVVVSLLIVNFSLGIMGKAVPQINVFITSIPINVLVGLMILIFSLPFLVDKLKLEIVDFADVFFSFMKVF